MKYYAFYTQSLNYRLDIMHLWSFESHYLITSARNYIKFPVLHCWSENKETNYIYILRCGKCNVTKKKIIIIRVFYPRVGPSRPRRSSGYHTLLWIRGSRVRSRPGSMDFFQSVKILSMTSFGREVKSWVPCRRITARKSTSSRNESLWAKFVGLFTLYVGCDADDLRC